MNMKSWAPDVLIAGGFLVSVVSLSFVGLAYMWFYIGVVSSVVGIQLARRAGVM